MRERMPRALRNAVAELIIEALDDEQAAVALARLGARLASAEGEEPELPRTSAVTLVCAELASAVPDARDAVRERLERALAAVATYRHARPLGTDPAAPFVPAGTHGATPALRKAAALFNAELYFEVHEVLEAAWGVAKGATRVFLQGLLQIAVALHHAEHGNAAGASRLLQAGRAKVLPHAPTFHGVDVAGLLDAVAEWERARAAGVPRPAAPRLVTKPSLGSTS
jgi:hypothetical protein